MTTRPYLKDDRLADVLALIQVLAFNDFVSRTHDGVFAELRRSPRTGASWAELAQEHPEFFRVGVGAAGKTWIALVARFVRPDHPIDETPAEPLDAGMVDKLMELAVTLHDRQLAASQRRWTVTLPVVMASLAAVAALLSGWAAIKTVYFSPSTPPAVVSDCVPPGP